MFVFWGNHLQSFKHLWLNPFLVSLSYSYIIITDFMEFCLWQKWGKNDTNNENAPHDSNKTTSPPQLTPPPLRVSRTRCNIVTPTRAKGGADKQDWSHLQSGLRRAPPPSTQHVCWSTVKSRFRLTGKKDRLGETKMEDPATRFHRLSSRVWKTQYCSLE